MNQSKKQSWADRIKKRNKMGFSLVELIVVIAIMAIMTAVLAPSLLSYVERARAQKDDSAMSEVVNSIQLALADQNVYDEVLCYTCDNIKSCYVDKANPLDSNRVETKNYGSTAGTYENGDHYIYNDNERLADESGYVFHGLMRGVTITFEPERNSNKTAFVLYNGYINASGHATGTGLNYLYGSCPETEKTSADMVTNGYTENMMLLGNMHSFSAPNHNYLYNRIRATVGDRIELTSQTYRNSCYTVFIRMGTTGGNQADKQDAIMVYGQWGGTNLSASQKGQGSGNSEIEIEVPSAYKTNFADNTWAEIADACKKNAVPATWNVGDTKEMEIDKQNYTVAIIGKNHDVYAEGGVAPLTFQVIDIVAASDMNSTNTNSGSWTGSELRATLNGDAFLNQLPYDVRNNLKAVVKKTNLGGADTGNYATTVANSQDKLFLLANAEVTGDAFWDYYNDVLVPWIIENQMADASDEEKVMFAEMYANFCSVAKAEGDQYAYYAATGDVAIQPTAEEFMTNSDMNYWYSMNAATLELNGSAAAWWLRSPYPGDSEIFFYVNETGSDFNCTVASAGRGVSFGFCF